MNSEEIKEAICDIPGVLDVESLHVWSLTIGQAALAGTIYLQPEIRDLKRAAIIVMRYRKNRLLSEDESESESEMEQEVQPFCQGRLADRQCLLKGGKARSFEWRTESSGGGYRGASDQPTKPHAGTHAHLVRRLKRKKRKGKKRRQDELDELDELIKQAETVWHDLALISSPGNSPLGATIVQDLARISTLRLDAPEPIRAMESRVCLICLRKVQELKKKQIFAKIASNFKKTADNYALRRIFPDKMGTAKVDP
ncbi:hypothetical protein BGX28_004406 [Mortierella sp. GBA30]|nr:hypothetical protein BGX28_004406 [Mortierella sp. GBA30]